MKEDAARYRRFAEGEAHGRSPLYEVLAEGVAEDEAVLERLAELPEPKRQPNLFFAAYRHLFGLPAGWAAFRARVLSDFPAIAAVMTARSTQTNEPARCAVLLPVLASLPQPLAILEVGASAGLCLLLELYGYDYGARGRIAPARADAPAFPCLMDAATPVPATMPRIAWRAGTDLNPLDPADAEAAAWPETLVWPEQAERAARLRAALVVAATAPPRIIRAICGGTCPAPSKVRRTARRG